MRCDEVKQELSRSLGASTRQGLADHLSACPACESWAAQIARQNEIWDATRPEEPSAQAFDALWERVTVLAAEPRPATLRFGSAATWKRAGLAVAVMAQAAAILIAALVVVNRPTPVAAMPVYEIEEGTTLVVSLGDGSQPTIRIQDNLSASETDTVGIDLGVLGHMESLSETSVADGLDSINPRNPVH